MKVEIRVEGSPEVGMGHVVRCLALAAELGGECRFLMRHRPAALRLVREAGWPALLLPDEAADEAAAAWVAASRPALLIVDLFNVAAETRELLAGVGCPSVALSDLRHYDLPGDLVFNGFIGFGRRETRPTRHGGVAWLGTDFKLVRAAPPARGKPVAPRARRVAITPGGGDASGLAPLALRALARLPGPLEIDVLEGPAMDAESDAYRAALAASPHPVSRHRTEHPFELLGAADLAISAGGDTVYELAVLGAPALLLCHVPHQLETASAFASLGAAENLGLTAECDEARLAEALERLREDAARRAGLSQRARQLVDGGGLRRVAALIRSLVQKESET